MQKKIFLLLKNSKINQIQIKPIISQRKLVNIIKHTPYIICPLIGRNILLTQPVFYQPIYNKIPNYSPKCCSELLCNFDDETEKEITFSSFVQSLFSGIFRFWRCLFRFLHLVVIFAPVVISSVSLVIPPLRSYWNRYFVFSLQLAGPVFIKLGQWASTRPDIFPINLIKSLRELQSNVRAENIEYSIKTLEKGLNCKVDDVFYDFDETPIGKGCIAQVYKAKLTSTGEEVAIKVLRDDVKAAVERDLSIVQFFANMLNILPFLKVLSLPDMSRQFCSIMDTQLNLLNEANNLNKFRKNFEKDQDVVFPFPYMNYCSENVLVESFEKGELLTEYIKTPSKYDVQLSYIGMKGYIQMLLVDNFIHADLHPGNVIVRIENNKPKFVVLDAGLVFSLAKTQRENFAVMFKKLNEGDGYGCGELLIERKPPGSADVINPVGFCEEMQRISNDCQEDNKFVISKVQMASVLLQVMKACSKYNVTLDAKFVSLFTSIIILEGVGRSLNPNLEIFGMFNMTYLKTQKEYYILRPSVINQKIDSDFLVSYEVDDYASDFFNM